MPPIYSTSEYSDMLSIFYECGKNALNASRKFLQQFPKQRQPSRATFINVEKTLRVTGRIQF